MRAMKRINFITIWYLVVLPLPGIAQQDANFTQYIFNTIHVNPAYAGYKNNLYLQSTYRKQWTGVEGAPESFSFAADALLGNEKVGLSLMVNNDKIGAQSNLGIHGGYAYHILIDDYTNKKLSFGFNIGLRQTAMNGSAFDANEAGDEYIPAGNESTIMPDARLGILFSSQHFFTGVSASNILSGLSIGQKENDWHIGLKPHLYFLGGLIVKASNDLIIKPMVLLKDDFGGPTNLDINGFILLKEKIWIGAMYRTSVKLYDKPHLQKDLSKFSSTGALIELFPTSKLRIGYSFDYSLNKLKNLNNGTHEISLGLFLRDKSNNRTQYGCYF